MSIEGEQALRVEDTPYGSSSLAHARDKIPFRKSFNAFNSAEQITANNDNDFDEEKEYVLEERIKPAAMISNARNSLKDVANATIGMASQTDEEKTPEEIERERQRELSKQDIVEHVMVEKRYRVPRQKAGQKRLISNAAMPAPTFGMKAA